MQEQNIDTNQQQQEILACFNYLNMALSHDTNNIRTAEQGLLQLSKNPQFIKILLNIPLVPTITNEVAKLAANYSRTYIRNLQVSQKQSSIIAAAYYMIDFLSFPTVQFPLKQEVGETLIYLLQRERTKSLLLSCQQKLLELLNSTTVCENVQEVKFQFIALFSYILIQSVPMPLINHSQFLMQSFGNIVKICGVFVKCMQSAIQQQKQNIELCFSLLNLFLDTILKYMKKLRMLGIEIVYLINNKDIKAVIDSVLSLSLPSNSYSYPLFHSTNKDIQTAIIQKYHMSKQKITQILNEALTILLHITKQTQHKNIIFMSQSKQFITIFISAINQLLNSKNYYELNCTVMEVMSQLYRYLGIMLNSNLHYGVFLSAKTMLIYGVIFKTLMFSPQDYAHFSSHAEQFVNSVYQIIEYEAQSQQKEVKIPTKLDSAQSNEQQEGDIEQWGTVKTLAASLLVSYTTHIDGSILELIVTALSVLDSRTTQTKYRKDQFLLVLCIIRKNVQYMENMKFKIGQVLITSLQLREMPLSNKQVGDINYENVEYGMLIATIDCYLPMIIQYAQLLCQSLLVVIQKLITNQQVQDSIKLLSMGVLTKITKTSQLQSNSDKIIELLWKTLTPSTVNIRSLDCLEDIVKELMQRAGELAGKNAMKQIEKQVMLDNTKQQQILKIGEGIVQLLQYYQTKKYSKIIVEKLWNILIQISANTHYMPTVVPHIRKLLSILLQVKKTQLVPSVKLCKCMSNIIKNSGMITQLEENYVGYIQQQFYNGEAKCSLNQYYDLLQHIIYYGANQLVAQLSPTNNSNNTLMSNGKSSKIVQLVLEMSIVSIREQEVSGIPRGESQCCQGILLLQSAIIALGKIFSQEVWAAILECLCTKYKNDTTYDFTKAELTTNLMLLIVFAYNYFDHGLISQLLHQLLRNHSYFTYKNSSKIFAIALIELIPLTPVPFIQQHYTQILDSAVSMLKLIQLGKDQQLQLQAFDTEETHYYQLKDMTRNCFTILDEFYLFQQEIHKVKNTELLGKAEKQLAENKKQYLKEILNVRKVGNNPRTIYRFKHK